MSEESKKQKTDLDDRSDEGECFQLIKDGKLDELKKLSKDTSIEIDWEDLFHWTVQLGNEEIYNFIRPKLGVIERSTLTWSIGVACHFGQLELLKKLMEEPGATPADEKDDPSYAFGGACERGHLHIVGMNYQRIC